MIKFSSRCTYLYRESAHSSHAIGAELGAYEPSSYLWLCKQPIFDIAYAHGLFIEDQYRPSSSMGLDLHNIVWESSVYKTRRLDSPTIGSLRSIFNKNDLDEVIDMLTVIHTHI
jgi:hypothetical protein